MVINEVSRNEKKREVKQAQNIITKPGMKGFKTMAILTAENSDTKQTPKQNKKFNESLLKDLEAGHYVAIPAKGKFDNVENSYSVLNITQDVASNLSGKYQQTSFVFSINNNGEITNEYWEKADPEKPWDKRVNPYIKKDEEKSVIKLDDADNYYTQIGKLKLTVPFSYFESVEENLDKLNINESMIEYSMKPGLSAYIWRGAIYKGIANFQSINDCKSENI